jgi:purine-nucleoside phosphorylase
MLPPPILDNKHPSSPSVFSPAALLREARRQKNLSSFNAPEVCILDPDGDLVRRLRSAGSATRFRAWACYHTDLFGFELGGRTVGILGCVVGAPFAVLVAEELFASGCKLLISLTSAGQVKEGPAESFVIIDRALRDEGTSYHYTEPSRFAEADPDLVRRAALALADGPRAVVGASWTTDAPFRETKEAIDAAAAEGIICVEMEAAALYALARAAGRAILCLAHVTNTMGQRDNDFEKGEADGTVDALSLLTRLVIALAPDASSGS